MIKFTARQLLKNKVLWLWPLFVLIFVVIVGIWGHVQPAIKHGPFPGPFVILLGHLQIDTTDLILQSAAIIVILGIIGLPKHFADGIMPNRASLILSKAVSRTELFLSDFASVFIVSLFYTLIMIFLLAIPIGIDAGIFPIYYYLALLILMPFSLLAYYITTVFLIMLTNSRLVGALIGYFLTGFSTVLINSDLILHKWDITSKAVHIIAKVFSYIIPSAAGLLELAGSISNRGFVAFKWDLVGFIIASFAPLFLLSYCMMYRREF